MSEDEQTSLHEEDNGDDQAKTKDKNHQAHSVADLITSESFGRFFSQLVSQELDYRGVSLKMKRDRIPEPDRPGLKKEAERWAMLQKDIRSLAHSVFSAGSDSRELLEGVVRLIEINRWWLWVFSYAGEEAAKYFEGKAHSDTTADLSVMARDIAKDFARGRSRFGKSQRGKRSSSGGGSGGRFNKRTRCFKCAICLLKEDSAPNPNYPPITCPRCGLGYHQVCARISVHKADIGGAKLPCAMCGTHYPPPHEFTFKGWNAELWVPHHSLPGEVGRRVLGPQNYRVSLRGLSDICKSVLSSFPGLPEGLTRGEVSACSGQHVTTLAGLEAHGSQPAGRSVATVRGADRPRRSSRLKKVSQAHGPLPPDGCGGVRDDRQWSVGACERLDRCMSALHRAQKQRGSKTHPRSPRGQLEGGVTTDLQAARHPHHRATAASRVVGSESGSQEGLLAGSNGPGHVQAARSDIPGPLLRLLRSPVRPRLSPFHFSEDHDRACQAHSLPPRYGRLPYSGVPGRSPAAVSLRGHHKPTKSDLLALMSAFGCSGISREDRSHSTTDLHLAGCRGQSTGWSVLRHAREGQRHQTDTDQGVKRRRSNRTDVGVRRREAYLPQKRGKPVVTSHEAPVSFVALLKDYRYPKVDLIGRGHSYRDTLVAQGSRGPLNLEKVLHKEPGNGSDHYRRIGVRSGWSSHVERQLSTFLQGGTPGQAQRGPHQRLGDVCNSAGSSEVGTLATRSHNNCDHPVRQHYRTIGSQEAGQSSQAHPRHRKGDLHHSGSKRHHADSKTRGRCPKCTGGFTFSLQETRVEHSRQGHMQDRGSMGYARTRSICHEEQSLVRGILGLLRGRHDTGVARKEELPGPTMGAVAKGGRQASQHSAAQSTGDIPSLVGELRCVGHTTLDGEPVVEEDDHTSGGPFPRPSIRRRVGAVVGPDWPETVVLGVADTADETRGLSRSTRLAYVSTIRAFSAVTAQNWPPLLTTEHVRDFLMSKCGSQAGDAIGKTYSRLRTWAGMLDQPLPCIKPVDLVQIRQLANDLASEKVSRSRSVVSPGWVRRFVTAATTLDWHHPPVARAILTPWVSFGLAARFGDLKYVKLARWCPKGALVRLVGSKTDKVHKGSLRWISLPHPLQEMAKLLPSNWFAAKAMASSPFAHSARLGSEPASTNELISDVKLVAIKAGIPDLDVCAHGFRRGAVTELLLQRHSPIIIRSIGGWTDGGDMLQRYAGTSIVAHQCVWSLLQRGG
eukprot:gnl/Dysnectes_brevis/390_a432_1797.p1 GENE.gnl/Dysnectes_brevis/390_a432_1797~~gnl/Dysnectes_brevis/390_a432_1797.p1  ORF type:complete len:1238 (-),score=94.42 gnl/Dysnectes_brevis/390_a432_1797:67-3780(-)